MDKGDGDVQSPRDRHIHLTAERGRIGWQRTTEGWIWDTCAMEANLAMNCLRDGEMARRTILTAEPA